MDNSIREHVRREEQPPLNLRELSKRVSELQRRLEALEARPIIIGMPVPMMIPPQPISPQYPTWAEPTYPTYTCT